MLPAQAPQIRSDVLETVSAGARLHVLWSLQGRQLWRATSCACRHPEPELSEDAPRAVGSPPGGSIWLSPSLSSGSVD